MALCKTIVGVPKDCGDNNQGSVKRVLFAEYLSVDFSGLVVTDTGDADTDGEVTAVAMVGGATFEEFNFPKNTSQFTQNLVTNLTADTHGYQQVLELGLRRLTLRKRNAISILAEGRRDLVAIVEDFNGDFYMLGSDQGLRLTENVQTTNMEREAGQSSNMTLTADYENHQWYKVDPTIVDALLPTP
jgi:hypothetical protein